MAGFNALNTDQDIVRASAQIRMLSTTSGRGVRGGSWIISSSDVST